MVLAITDEAKTARECHAAFAARRDALIGAFTAAGIPGEAIVTDFIALLPVFSWRLDKQAGREVAVEHLTGHRLQNNLHVRVATEAGVEMVAAIAFEHGVTDVIAIDYWSDVLDDHKAAAQQQAVEQAQRKAKLLLGALFPTEARPLPLNVHEHTDVIYPKDAYASFNNAFASTYQGNFNDRIPSVAAFRPKNTYYRGFFQQADAQADALPMHPEISVVATVKLYYATPVRPGPADAEKK